MRLKDKVAVVLGASAEAGSGWAVARRFAAEGAKVVVAARRTGPLEKLAREIGGEFLSCDVASEEDVRRLAQFTKQTFGRLDVAVNAAGLPMGGTIEATPKSEMIQAIEVNYYGSVYFVKHMADAMQAEGGSIILFSTMTSVQTMEFVYSYACAKAAADCLVRYAAIEYGPRNIRVNSILPGAIRSEMSSALWQVEGMENAYAQEIPLGRIGEPEDFADAALWLAGPAYVTGLNLTVSGGSQLRRFPRLHERPAMEGPDPTNA